MSRNFISWKLLEITCRVNTAWVERTAVLVLQKKSGNKQPCGPEFPGLPCKTAAMYKRLAIKSHQSHMAYSHRNTYVIYLVDIIDLSE